MYELTHFHFSSWKDPFFDVVSAAMSGLGLNSVADVGCGVGLDAQALAVQGWDVMLYDVDSPSRRYADWRLRREWDGEPSVVDIEELGTGWHDLVYAVDVLEHLPDPAALVPRLFAAGRHVCVNLFPHDKSCWDGRDMHHPLDHWCLLPEFSRRADLLQVAMGGDTVTTLWRGRR